MYHRFVRRIHQADLVIEICPYIALEDRKVPKNNQRYAQVRIIVQHSSVIGDNSQQTNQANNICTTS